MKKQHKVTLVYVPAMMHYHVVQIRGNEPGVYLPHETLNCMVRVGDTLTEAQAKSLGRVAELIVNKQ